MMSSKANKQATLQLIASVVVAGLIVIGISTIAGYLPTGQQQQSTQNQVHTYHYITTTCDSSGCHNVVVTATSGPGGTGTVGNSTTTGTSTSTSSSGQISNFNIKGTPSASFRDIVLANGPAILIVTAAAIVLIVLAVRKNRKSR